MTVSLSSHRDGDDNAGRHNARYGGHHRHHFIMVLAFPITVIASPGPPLDDEALNDGDVVSLPPLPPQVVVSDLHP